jgi:serine/threonine-protein kinase RsbW
MQLEEAMDVSRLVYQGYGYSYLHEHLYYPDRVVKLHVEDKIHSAIAVTPANEIAGHVACKEEERQHPWKQEWGSNRKFRKQAIAENLGP